MKGHKKLNEESDHVCCFPTLNIATFYVSLDSNTSMGIEHQKIFNKNHSSGFG